MSKLRVLDLFSGLGGFSLGLERTGGFETVAFCEIEPFPRRVLAKHWPHVPCYDDVRTLTAERLRADGIAVDVICGGFPCQDISTAGSQAGLAGARSGLWSEIARLVGELRPQFLLVENVPNLLNGRGGHWFGTVLGDLASLGLDAEWHCIPAAVLGAEHPRDRVWIVAHAPRLPEHHRFIRERDIICSIETSAWGEFHSIPSRTHDGVSSRVDRLRALGNAVVPQIPELIGRAILASLQEAA